MKKQNSLENINDRKNRVHQNIELCKAPQTFPIIKKTNLLNNKDSEDEDFLNKFIEKKRKRRFMNKNSFNRDRAFSTVRHQIKDEFSLGKLGKIEWAKEHASANRPLNKINEFTKSTKFCNCCNLPCETPGIIESFSCFEKTENFSACGKAVPLYFYYIKYCIFCLFLIFFAMSIPITLINNKHLLEIKQYCKYLNINNNSNIGAYHNEINVTSICEKYLETNNSITNFFNWFYKTSNDNILDYKKLLNYTGHNNYDNIFINYSFIGFYCMLSLFIFNVYYIILFKAKIKLEKYDNIQPSDYTVLITDLQKMVNEFKKQNEEKDNIIDNNQQDDLTGGISDYDYSINMNFLKTQIGQFTQFLIDNLFYNKKYEQNINIFNLNLCYKLNDFMVLKEKQEKCKYKIFQVKNNPYQIEKNILNNCAGDHRRYYESPFTLIGLDWLLCSNKGVTLEELNKENELYEKKLNSLVTKAKLKNFCGCIFATFNTLKDKEDFYNKYPHFYVELIFYYLNKLKYHICCCFIDKKNNKTIKRIRVHSAPEPEDVIWENMEFTVLQRFFRIVFIYCLSISLILITLLIVYYLNEKQKVIEKKNWNELLKYIGSFAISIIISILNVILEIIMKTFTKMEKPKSMTSYYLSYSIKLSIFTFVTSAFVPFLSNYFSGRLKKHDNATLINNMFFLFLTNSFLKPIIWTINIPLIIKKIRIFFIERKLEPNLVHHKTQKELNDIYEYPDMDIASKYSYINMTLLMSMFYLPIFPVGVTFSLLGLILAYFLEKYNFTHNYKRPKMMNERLGEFYLNIFICIMISYSFGDYFFNKGLFINDIWPNKNIIIFGILSLIPYTKLIVNQFNKKFEHNSTPINDIYFSFYNDYQRQNPFTKKEGMYFYINELRNRGYISKFLYDILIKNIEKINVMEIYYNTSKNFTLNQTQQSLARIKNKKKFSMDDLKKSIVRIVRERFENSRKSGLECRQYTKSLDILSDRDYIIGDDEKTEDSNEIEKKNEAEIQDSINNNNGTININIENIKDDNNKNARRSTTIVKPKIKALRINKKKDDDNYDEEKNYNLTQAITNKDKFLINQYKDPLFFSIGTGIKNLAFMDDSMDEEIKKSTFNKNSDKNDNSDNNDSEDNMNIIVEENEDPDEDIYEK